MTRKFLIYLWNDWFRQVGEALLAAFIVTTFAFTTVGVFGQSMYPTLSNQERVIVPKYVMWAERFGLSSYQRGDIAILKPPAGAPNERTRFPVLGFEFRPYFIKRIIGIPGDRVSVKEGKVYLNGTALEENYITDYITPYPDSFPELWIENGRPVSLAISSNWLAVESLPPYLARVMDYLAPIPDHILEQSFSTPVRYTGEMAIPADHYFVMGDNRRLGGSEDSRIFGPVAADQIAGTANFVWWPPVASGPDGWRLNWRVLEPPEAFQKIDQSTSQ